MSQDVSILAEKLEQWFNGKSAVAVALSGGIDSSLVAFAARRFLGSHKTVAVISSSASLKVRELTEAKDFAKAFDIPLVEIDSKEIEDINYSRNPVNRCFFCKTSLYSTIEKLIADQFPGYVILNGNNASDFGDYRPGLQASKDYQVLSPLAETQFYKEDIRELARFWGIPHWNKPASPCLSSRFPYGESITVEKLAMVEKAEDALSDYGFNDVRVRYMNNGARIEVPQEQLGMLKGLFPEIQKRVQSFGFVFCEIDQEGLVSGKLNRHIKLA